MISFSELIRQSRFLPYAHRGASKLAPENTLAAFQYAYDLGFKIIETDVRCSTDGVVYAFHDQTLQRMVGDARKIEDLTSHQIDELRIEEEHPIPKLQDLYEAFPQAYFNLDAKSWNCVEPLIALVERVSAGERTCFGSFSQARLDVIAGRISGSSPAHSFGTRGAVGLYLNYLVNRVIPVSETCAQLPVKRYGVTLVNSGTLRYYRSLGLKTYVWTVNDAAEMQRLIDIGVDGIMTDDCVLLKSVLQKNGLW
ncbi:MAG: glycerophosphodiester phosphodiesterase family protein [Rhizobiaceae bacterium]